MPSSSGSALSGQVRSLGGDDRREPAQVGLAGGHEATHGLTVRRAAPPRTYVNRRMATGPELGIRRSPDGGGTVTRTVFVAVAPGSPRALERREGRPATGADGAAVA